MPAPEQTRVKCVVEGCSNLILPATSQANKGLCAPCFGKQRQEERSKYIRENSRDVDPFVGLSDPVEIIRVAQTTRRHDPLIRYLPPARPVEELYRDLNERDAGRLMDIAVEAKRAGDDHLADAIAKSLACLTENSLDQMLEAWVAEEEFWPAMRNSLL